MSYKSHTTTKKKSDPFSRVTLFSMEAQGYGAHLAASSTSMASAPIDSATFRRSAESFAVLLAASAHLAWTAAPRQFIRSRWAYASELVWYNMDQTAFCSPSISGWRLVEWSRKHCSILSP